MNKVLQNNLSQIAQFPQIFSVIPFYFRFFRYKKILAPITMRIIIISH